MYGGIQLAIVQLQRAQLLRAIDLTEVEVRDQMMDQARNRKKVRTPTSQAIQDPEAFPDTSGLCVLICGVGSRARGCVAGL